MSYQISIQKSIFVWNYRIGSFFDHWNSPNSVVNQKSHEASFTLDSSAWAVSLSKHTRFRCVIWSIWGVKSEAVFSRCPRFYLGKDNTIKEIKNRICWMHRRKWGLCRSSAVIISYKTFMRSNFVGKLKDFANSMNAHWSLTDLFQLCAISIRSCLRNRMSVREMLISLCMGSRKITSD